MKKIVTATIFLAVAYILTGCLSRKTVLSPKYELCINTKGDTVHQVLPAPRGYAYDIDSKTYVRIKSLRSRPSSRTALVADTSEYTPYPDFPGWRH